MTELFNKMAIVGDAIEEEDRVVYLLAILPDSFNTLVTALKVNEDVPKMEVITDRLLHSERKQKEKASVDLSEEKAMTLKFKVEVQGVIIARSWDTFKSTVWSVSRPKERRNRMDLGLQIAML